MQIFGTGKKQSNERIVEQLLLENYNQYYRFAYSYVHNDADAADIVQNGAYKALRGCADLRSPEYASTWVYRIMLNEVFALLRKPQMESYEFLHEQHGDVGEGSEDRYTDIDLQRAMDALPPTEKAIIIMKYFEDKKLEEIAEILGENISTVKSRLYRSIRKLRGMLEGNEERDEHIKHGRMETGK